MSCMKPNFSIPTPIVLFFIELFLKSKNLKFIYFLSRPYNILNKASLAAMAALYFVFLLDS